MFDLVNGLPVHPLVVHGVVVLLPLGIMGTVAIAVRRAWRVRYGSLVVADLLVATILIPIATSSGEALERHVGRPGNHAQLGDQLIWFAVPLLVLAIGLVVLERRSAKAQRNADVEAPSPSSAVFRVVAALAVVAAVAAGVQVYRVGDSGARAAWADRVDSSPVAVSPTASGRDHRVMHVVVAFRRLPLSS